TPAVAGPDPSPPEREWPQSPRPSESRPYTRLPRSGESLQEMDANDSSEHGRWWRSSEPRLPGSGERSLARSGRGKQRHLAPPDRALTHGPLPLGTVLITSP